MSAPFMANLAPSSFGRYPVIFYIPHQPNFCSLRSSLTYSWGRDVREIRCNTWSIDNIVQGELGDERAGLEEKGQWLLGGGANCQ